MKKFTFYLFAFFANLILANVSFGQILQRGSSTTASSANATLTINKPTGVVAGDVMIVNIAQSDDNDAVDSNPTATGWTLIAGADLGGGTQRWGSVLYRVADGTEGASFVFTLDAQATGSQGSIVAFFGVDGTGGVNQNGAPGGPFDVDPGSLNVTDAATATATSIATSNASAAVIMFAQVAGSNSSYSSWTIGGGIAPFTELYDNGTTTGEDASVGAAWGIKVAAGSTGNGTVTLSPDERSGAILIALRPANAGPPPVANLWATSTNGTQISSFTVANGVYISGPNNIFAPGTSSTAALGRNAQPNAVNGHFYWLPNSGVGGVVNVWAATATGASQTNIATFDVNGSSTNNLGFVRLGMGPNGVGWILAGDGTTLYLARFISNGVNPVTVVVEDDNVQITGGSVATFQNGDLCISGNGRIYALANDGGGVTQIFTGLPAGSSTVLDQVWDLEDEDGDPFTGRVNGVAFDVLGSLYISTDNGLYYINQATVNGPAGTVECALVQAVSGLQDLASNVFPTQSTLPVKLLSFSGSLNNEVTTLTWITEDEQNFSHYEIQRSNGSGFVTVGSKASSNSASKVTYQHADNLSAVNGNVFYYRLKLVNKDGKFSYSNEIMVRKSAKAIVLTVNPNPVENGIATVRFTATSNSIANFRVVDMAGKVVLQQQNQIFEGTNSITLTGIERLLPGTYVLQMSNGQELSMFKFTVAR
jgi:hypothetical protein